MLSSAIQILLTIWVLWIFYLAVMSLYRAHNAKTLSIPAKLLGYPVLAVGVALDAIVNILLISLIFAERPREWLLTQRLARHIKTGNGWRKTMSIWICDKLLNPFDPDRRGHCK